MPDARRTVDDRDGAILRQRRVLQAVIHHDRGGADLQRQPRAGGPVARDDDGRGRGKEQRLVADLARGVRVVDLHRAALGCRRSRATGKAGDSPDAARSSATAMAVGVLPAPPAVKLPMQITGNAAVSPRRFMRRARDRAIDEARRRSRRLAGDGFSRHQKAGARISGALRASPER